MDKRYSGAIIRRARKAVAAHGELDGRCLYWAHEIALLLHADGFRPIIQAGTASWRIVPRHLDDGQESTHVSFIWSPTTEESIRSIMQGGLPEMHVWVGLFLERGNPASAIIVDGTTGELIQLARRLGYVWRTPPPPPYLWGQPFPGSSYTLEPQACQFAMKAIFDLFGGRPAYCPANYEVPETLQIDHEGLTLILTNRG